MKELFIPLTLAILQIASSCVPSKTIADTCCPRYKNENFKRNGIADKGMAVMPEIGPNKNEIRSSPIRDEITLALQKEFGEEVIISSGEVIETLNEVGLSNEYFRAVTEFRSSGTVPRDFMAIIGNDLEVDYLLFIKLLPDSYEAHSSRIELHELFVRIQVLSAADGNIAWEGIGGCAVYKDPAINITSESAKSIVQIIGNEPNEGPCESTAEIIASVNMARVKSILGLVLVGMVTVLLAPVLLTWKVV